MIFPQTTALEVKQALEDLLIQVQKLTSAVMPQEPHPDFSNLRWRVSTLPTTTPSFVVDYNMGVANKPQALLPTTMTDPSCTQLEWMLACYYAEKRAADPDHHSRDKSTKPTNQDIIDAKRVCVVLAFLGA